MDEGESVGRASFINPSPLLLNRKNETHHLYKEVLWYTLRGGDFFKSSTSLVREGEKNKNLHVDAFIFVKLPSTLWKTVEKTIKVNTMIWTTISRLVFTGSCIGGNCYGCKNIYLKPAFETTLGVSWPASMGLIILQKFRD